MSFASSSPMHSPSLRCFSVDPPTSINKQPNTTSSSSSKRKKPICVCSPTTHPGSFHCAFHRKLALTNNNNTTDIKTTSVNQYNSIKNVQTTTFYNESSNTMKNVKTAAYNESNTMKNSSARISGIERVLVKRALSRLFPDSPKRFRPRTVFQPKPTRFSLMSKA